MLASVNALAHRSACRINGSPANDLHAGASGAAREALSPHSAAEKTTLAAFTPTEARRAVFVQRAELGTHAGASECPDLPHRARGPGAIQPVPAPICAPRGRAACPTSNPDQPDRTESTGRNPRYCK